jgi:hypothetical protein
MVLSRPAIIFAMIMLAAVSACSSQPVDIASVAGAQGNTDKCDVDVKRVCQEMRNRPVRSTLDGTTEDQAGREQNFQHTATLFVQYQIPNGSNVGVECEINTQHNSVVYAHLMPGSALTPTDIAFIKEHGYCAH